MNLAERLMEAGVLILGTSPLIAAVEDRELFRQLLDKLLKQPESATQKRLMKRAVAHQIGFSRIRPLLYWRTR